MPAERMRPLRWRDAAGYVDLMRRAFSEAPAREVTGAGLARAATVYARLFPLFRALSWLGLLPAGIPEVLACERDGRLAGLASICRRGGRAGAPLCLLHTAVDPACRRLGIATRLLAHLVATLDPAAGHRIIAKVREQNRPMLANLFKSGFRPYAREFTFAFDRLAGAGRPQPGEAVRASARGEFAAFKRSQTPAALRRIDPAAAAPFGRPRGGLSPLADLATLRIETAEVLVRGGAVVAAVLGAYHRLQRTVELDVAARPGEARALGCLLHRALGRCARAPRRPVLCRVCDAQRAAREALIGCGFIQVDAHRLLCLRIPPAV